jgi:hypothetical protein
MAKKVKISFDILPVLKVNRFALVKKSKLGKVKNNVYKVKTKRLSSTGGY